MPKISASRCCRVDIIHDAQHGPKKVVCVLFQLIFACIALLSGHWSCLIVHCFHALSFLSHLFFLFRCRPGGSSSSSSRSSACTRPVLAGLPCIHLLHCRANMFGCIVFKFHAGEKRGSFLGRCSSSCLGLLLCATQLMHALLLFLLPLMSVQVLQWGLNLTWARASPTVTGMRRACMATPGAGHA